MTLIQVALDTLDFNDTINLARQVAPYVDIVELGTPCIKYNGVGIVKRLKSVVATTNTMVLADLKTMDAGYYESLPFYEAGADICTVLGAADFGTIEGVIKAAKETNKKVQVDLINVSDKQSVVKHAIEAGADILGIHTGLDQQARGVTPFADLASVSNMGNGIVRISVAGGINSSTVAQAIAAGANIIVAGAAIYGAADPVAAAKAIRDAVDAVTV